MMADLDIDQALERRLETLDEDVGTCCEDLPRLVEDARSSSSFTEHLERYRAIADEKRLLVLAMLARSKTLCACEVQAALGVTHATVSHHMGTLRAAGLVESEKRGKWVFYRLSDDVNLPLP